MRAATLLLCLFLFVAAPSATASEVIRTGAQLPHLVGEAPGTLVGFAWTSGHWVQVPVQVDERLWLDIATAFVGRDRSGCAQGPDCEGFVGLVEVLEYADPGTLVGPDPDPAFDEDDELVFMSDQLGTLAPAGRHPAGVVERTQSVVVAQGGGVLYLYSSDAGLDPAAGADLVTYRFALEAGAFPQAYDFFGSAEYNVVNQSGERLGSNPERSFAETAHYRLEFSDRWISDALYIKPAAGWNAAPDLLDRRKFLFEPGYCERSEWTGSVGHGTIVAAIDGPVRGIRVVRGFNSGPFTTRTTYFYERDVVSVTDLRVHSVPSLMDVMDYAPTLQDATYDNQENYGLRIDTRPDAFAAASRRANEPFWEVVNSPSGSIATALQIATDWTDLRRLETLYLEGDHYTQCTGDAMDRGTSGFLVDQLVPWTDPRNPVFVTLAGLRRSHFAAGRTSRAEAEALATDAFAYYAATPTRRYDGTPPSPSPPPEEQPPPPEEPPTPPEEPPAPPEEPPAEGEADLAIVYDGVSATVTNLGPATATGVRAGYRGRTGIVAVDLPPLAPGETYQQRTGAPQDGCVRVRAGDQPDPNPQNNRACLSNEAAAYPNPFNPSTTITYTLPRRMPVSVRVFDMLGREVAVLVDNERQRGTQTVRFDAAHLASGLYLYRVETPTRTTTGRLLLLK